MRPSPAFPCAHCGAHAYRRHPLDADERALAHLSVCTACGENVLAVVHEDADQGRVETWDYYLDRTPSLRRVRGYERRGRLDEPVRVASLFFVGDESVTERSWKAALAERRAGPSNALATWRAEDRLTTGVLGRCRAWWSRQAGLDRLPTALLLSNSDSRRG